MGFVSEHILNIARYRVRGGGDLSLQVNAIRYGEAQAITLDYVIVFKDENDALYNPTLWAHELTHIEQFQRWGIRDFSIRYLRSHPSVENEAYQAETRYLAWVSVKNTQQWASTGNSANFAAANRPIAPFSNGANSSTCSTTMGMCRVNGVAPVGTSCWCNHPVMGAAAGALTPDLSPPGIQAPVLGFLQDMVCKYADAGGQILLQWHLNRGAQAEMFASMYAQDSVPPDIHVTRMSANEVLSRCQSNGRARAHAHKTIIS